LTPSIEALGVRFDVAPLVEQLARNPDVWNRHAYRTKAEDSPHRAVSDIWVRYASFDALAALADPVNDPHESMWYPCVAQIPAAWSLARRVFRHVGGKRLGGVLITRIPAGGEVKPHIDRGWHAGYYEKFAVQVKGNAEQAFCFEDARLSPLPGDVYTFQNDRLHWVENPSNDERITLIVCVRR
jgi:hypothetical protein